MKHKASIKKRFIFKINKNIKAQSTKRTHNCSTYRPFIRRLKKNRILINKTKFQILKKITKFY